MPCRAQVTASQWGKWRRQFHDCELDEDVPDGDCIYQGPLGALSVLYAWANLYFVS